MSIQLRRGFIGPMFCGFMLLALVSTPMIRAEDAPIIPGDKTAPVTDPNLPTGDWSLKSVGRKSPLYINGQLVHPVGKTVDVKGSPRGVALAQHGKFLLAKTSSTLAVLEAENLKVIKQFPIDGGGSMHGLTVSTKGDTCYFSNQQSSLLSASIDETGVLTLGPAINLKLGKEVVCPLGVALAKQDTIALVALSSASQLAVVDLSTRQVTARIDVGVCPYSVVLAADGNTVFVSNFGGPRPRPGDKTEKSAGVDVALDARSVALRGSVSVVDLTAGKAVAEIETRIHPESMVLSPDGKTLYVVDASGDCVNVIDVAQRKSVKLLSTRVRADLPYGALSNGIAISADGATLFVANGGNNAIALIDPKRAEDKPYALIPTGVFPGAICVDGKNVYIGNVEGFGGDLQKATLPATEDERATMTRVAEEGFHFPEIVRSLARARTGVNPVPVPLNPGEPSNLKHVVYIIKENKKFDQVLGDESKGNCDPKLCEFPRAITPNAHALADEFVLLDNYFCCSGNSATGHQWAVQGLLSPYRAKGEAPRVTYDFGVDPLSYAGCGFIWDHVLRQGVSFRNFGEMDYAIKAKGSTWKDYYEDWKLKAGKVKFECDYKVDVLNTYSDKRFPGWELSIPDQLRADVFLTALKEYEAAGKLPEFIIIYLPNDHGQNKKDNPTPRAYVADNDLAMGRIVEALSKSKFWNDMVIIANEDDPQTGADHVSGYRSICFVASPYAKRHTLVSRFYNQSSVLHTICNILGVPPMNQMVASTPLMSDCFQNTPDFTPYVCLPESIALDELVPDPKAAKSPKQAELLLQTQQLNFSAPDLLKKKESELFSRYVWSTTKGDEPFPLEFWGAHGKGLAQLGLTLESIGAEKDDDDD